MVNAQLQRNFEILIENQNKIWVFMSITFNVAFLCDYSSKFLLLSLSNYKFSPFVDKMKLGLLWCNWFQGEVTAVLLERQEDPDLCLSYLIKGLGWH